MTHGQRQGFEDRLARIQKGGVNTMGEVHIGPRDEVRASKKSKPANTVRMKKKKNGNKEIGRSSGSTLIILAFIFGALSMFVGQSAAFHFFHPLGLIQLDLSETALAPHLSMAHLAIGGVLGLLFCWTFRLTSILRLAAMGAGLFVMVEYHNDMIKSVPGVYTQFFHKEYVKQVILEQQPPAA